MQSTESVIVLDENTNMVISKAFVCAVRYYYDTEDGLTKKHIEFADGKEFTENYEKTENDSQVVKFTAGGKTVASHSKNDSFGRKVFDELQLSTGFISRQFSYHAGEVTEEHVDNNMLKSSPTTQLVSQIVLSGGRTISYEYDEEERITKVTDSLEGVTEYTYDALGQLVSERHKGNDVEVFTTINEMTYDNYGNILTKNGVVYDYDTVWKDKLIKVGDKTITYDEQGNPTQYLGHNLTWEKGRQLKSFEKVVNDTKKLFSYTYNANGIRTSKTVDNIRHDFVLDGAKILREGWNFDETINTYRDILVPLYDNEDSVCGIEYNGTAYYFLKNLQGDIIAITDSSGEEVARYSYDAWGKVTVFDTNGVDITKRTTHIANINPYRYRSYYFDLESGLYYLQSRYYDAQVGRFVNGDEVIYTFISKDASGYNTFEYCNNDCINLKDKTGNAYVIDDALATCVGAVIIAVVIVLIAWLISFFSSNEFKKEWSKSRTMTSSTFISGLILIYAGVAIRNWFQKLKTSIKKEILKFIATQIYLNSTIALATVKPLLTQSKVYRVAYAIGKQLVQVGKWLTFVEALSVLGIKKAAYSLSRRYSVKIKKRPANCLTKNWGMYTKKQSYACALATVLGCNSDPEVNGSGYYGHYHDKKHVIHIWYGEPIVY